MCFFLGLAWACLDLTVSCMGFSVVYFVVLLVDKMVLTVLGTFDLVLNNLFV